MKRSRREMTVRIVPLASAEAGDGRVGGSAAGRLALVRDLSRRMWALSGQPVPSYTRSTIPARLTRLAEQ